MKKKIVFQKKSLLKSSKPITKTKHKPIPPSQNFPKISSSIVDAALNKDILDTISIFFNFLKEVAEKERGQTNSIKMTNKAFPSRSVLKTFLLKIVQKYNFNQNQSPYIKFGSNIDGKTFLEILTQIINTKYLEEKILTPERIFEYDSLADLNHLNISSLFRTILNDNSALWDLKIDFFLTALISPSNYEMDTIIQILKIDKFEEKDKIFLHEKNNGILEKITTSNVAINGFIMALKTQKGKNVLDAPHLKSQIKIILKKFLNKIYVTDLPKDILGVSLFTGRIFINRKYYDHPWYFFKQKNAVILTILLHEITHVLRRILIDDNFLNSAREFSKGSIRFLDLGDYFDHLLFGKMEMLYEQDAAYLLDEKNWSVLLGYAQFKRDFIQMRRAIPQNQKRNGFLLKHKGFQIGFGGVSKSGFCGLFVRRCKNFL